MFPVTLILLFVLVLWNYVRFRDPLYPPFLQALLWFGVTFLYWLNLERFLHLSLATHLILINGVVMFSVGSYLATCGYVLPRRSSPIVEPPEGNWYSDLILWVSVACFPLLTYKMYQFGVGGPSDSFFFNLRFAMSGDDPSQKIGVVAYAGTLSMVAAGLLLLMDRKGCRNWKLVLSVFVALLYALMSTGRTNLFLLVLMLVGISVMTGRLSVSKGLLIFGLGGLTAFVSIGTIYGKVIQDFSTVSDALRDVKNAFLGYLLSPLPAFDTHMHTYAKVHYGSNTLRTFLAVLGKVGYDVDVPQLVRGYQFVPMPTNVYTVYEPYFNDFLLPGVILIQLLFGYIHGHVYKNARNGHLFNVFLYGVLLYPLAMQFFQDQYFNLLSMWIQVLSLTGLYFLLQKRPWILRLSTS